MAIHILDVYRSPNIGIFLKATDRFLFVPAGMADTKVAKLASFLGVEPIRASIYTSRLLGALMVVNGRGILVSRLIEEQELNSLRSQTGMLVERLPGSLTSAGNLIAANDKGAVVSPLLPPDAIRRIRDVLGVEAVPTAISGYFQAGSMMVTTNGGSVIHPAASEAEVSLVADVLRCTVEPSTVNGGVPFVASGMLANSRQLVVGSRTTGPELMILSRAFGM